MNITENKYLNMSDTDIDNLLLGVDLKLNKESLITLKCISCNSDNLVADNSEGHMVCQNCGVVNKELLDKNPEYNNNSKASNYGCPSSYFFPKSALGSKIKTRGYNKISSLQCQGQMPYKEKSLLIVLNTIQIKCKKYNITQSIIDSAKILYKKVTDSKHTKGNRKGKNRIMRCINRRSMIAACVFYACKLQKEPRSPKEIADIYDLEIKHVNRGCRKFLDYIDINTFHTQFKSSQSTDFIERFAKKLNIDNDFIKIAKDISENIHKLDIASTHEPPSVAAGCLLLIINMYHLDITKKQISDIFKISDVTISKTYRRIYPYHKIIMNNKITNLIIEKRSNTPVKKVNLSEQNIVIKKEPLYLSESEETPTESITCDNSNDKVENNSIIL